MVTLDVQLLHAGESALGEGPLWDAAAGRMLWVDLLAGVVFSGAAETGPAAIEVFRAEPGQTIAAVVPRRQGGFAVCLRRSILLVDSRWNPERQIELDDVAEGFRLSDACAGPAGELWVGVVATGGPGNADAEADCRGLYRVTRQTVIRALPDVGFANGMGFSPAGNLHLVDSDARTISEYPYDARTATLGEPATIVHTDPSFGAPDGLAIDEDGAQWVAFFGGHTIRRHSTASGWDITVDVGVPNATSCAFIGDDLNRLAITTARVELDDDGLERWPLSGSILVADPGTRGAPRHHCNL